MGYDVVFESERILFVRVNESLVDDYLKMINDEDIQKSISDNRWKLNREQEIEWVKKNLENNTLVFSMIERSTNSFIGNIEIMSINNGVGLIGIAITKDKQNQHFGQEGIKRLYEYAVKDLGLEGLELTCFSTNERGINCYKKVGFIEDGQECEEGNIHMSMRQ